MNLTTPDLHRTPRLHALVSGLDALVRRTGDEAVILAEGAPLLSELTTADDWLPDLYAQPDPQRQLFAAGHA